MGEDKAVLRLHCNYLFNDLKEVVSRVLDSISLTKICQFSRHSARYISAYELELSGKVAVFAVKWYHSYCQVSASILEEFGDM